MTIITLLHTAQAHVATFDTLAARIAPDVQLVHVVREDWLARAQDGVDDTLAAEIAAMVAQSRGPTICTCTTLGPAAAAAGAFRIDAPMMAAAARLGPRIVPAYAVHSTAAPSQALLNEALTAAGTRSEVIPLDLSEFWPLFEAGETEAYTACIAGGIRDAARGADPSCAVLCQASMTGAAPLLHDLPFPILSSPETALRAALYATP